MGKKEPPRPRPQLMKIPLIERLREESAMGIPALGLSYINEWINPKHPDEPRRYTCVLEGCKSAWGDSEDMYRHLVGKSMLHNKNYLIYHLKQDHVKHYKKDELTEACVQCDKKERGMKLEKDRDYSQIKRNMDYKMYKELVNRPMDWSEKKEKHGIMPKNDFKKGAGKGANLEPLGQKRKSIGSKDNPNLVPYGDNPQRLVQSCFTWKQETEIECNVAFQKFEKLCQSIDSLIEKNPQTLEKATTTLKKPDRVAKCLTSLLKQKEFGNEFGYDVDKCVTRSKRIRDDICYIEEENMNKSRNLNTTIKKEKGRSNSPDDGKSERTGRETSSNHSPDSGYNGDNGVMQRCDQQIKSEYRTNADLNHNPISSPDAVLRNFYDSIQIFVLKTLKNFRDAGEIPPEWVNDKTKSISTKIYDAEVTNWQQQGEPLDTIDLTSDMKKNMVKYISNTIVSFNQSMLSRY